MLENIQGKTSVSEASRTHDLPPSEIESRMEDGRRGMEYALKANNLPDVREQHERQLKELQEAYGEGMLELRARTKLQSLPGWQMRKRAVGFRPRIQSLPSVATAPNERCATAGSCGAAAGPRRPGRHWSRR